MWTRGWWDAAGRWGLDFVVQVTAALVFLVFPVLLARLLAAFG